MSPPKIAKNITYTDAFPDDVTNTPNTILLLHHVYCNVWRKTYVYYVVHDVGGIYMKQQSTRGGYILTWCYPYIYCEGGQIIDILYTNCSKHNKWRRKRLPMLYTATNWVWSKGIRYILKVGGERKEVGYASSHL